jgi:Flp pilus assembly pilin Flp
MSDLITTTQDSFRDQCIEAYFGFGSLITRLVERSREDRGQTAAEYMGVLLVVAVIIAGVSKTHLGTEIVAKLSSLVNSISSGSDPTAAG